ncbi:MAG: hypothetical protein JOZ19_10490 [Rubrobacter sp.]|nr:hypothetical protein [Rubrobacter sp.]
MYLANYFGMLCGAELELAEGFRNMGEGHGQEPDVYFICHTLAKQCDEHVEKLRPFAERYGEIAPEERNRLGPKIFVGPREGGLGLLRDLHDLYVMASFCSITWTMVGQGAQGTRNPELLEVVESCESETATQMKWLETRMKQAAPQALIAAS